MGGGGGHSGHCTAEEYRTVESKEVDLGSNWALCAPSALPDRPLSTQHPSLWMTVLGDKNRLISDPKGVGITGGY